MQRQIHALVDSAEVVRGVMKRAGMVRLSIKAEMPWARRTNPPMNPCLRGASSRLEGGARGKRYENSLVGFRDIGLRVPGRGAMWLVGAPRAVPVRDVELSATRRPFALRKSKSWDMKRGEPQMLRRGILETK